MLLAALLVSTAYGAGDETRAAGAAPTAANAATQALGAARPRIGLVLSGGGARGTAHIGVLKVLDELHVPIDAIAGTSMGAVVGGLYASGFTGKEIDSIVSSLDWQDAFRDRPPRTDLTFRRKQEDQNFLVKLPLGLRGGRFLLPRGLIQGQRLSQTLRRLTLPVAQITNFDELPVPFRAVATDLETGDSVVMGSGDLTDAMRASLSAPGVFAPVERDGRLLVDGGLAENLPIDVARMMGVDVLIVVDVGFPLRNRDALTTAPIVSNQMLAILIRRNGQLQRATLTGNDIVIDPPLGEASSFDFGIVRDAIAKGELAARGVSARLSAYAVDSPAWERYLARRSAAREPPPRIDYVRIDPGSEHYREPIEAAFEDLVGQPLNQTVVASRVSELYGEGNLETLDYRLEHVDGENGLVLSARRNSWGPNYVRFGLNLQDDFKGDATFNAAARIVLSEITHLGGEWVWDFQVGESPRIATELYFPLSWRSPFFVSPQAGFSMRNVPLLVGQQRLAEFRVRDTEYGIDFGREFSNWGEVRMGLRRHLGSEHVLVGNVAVPVGAEFDSRGLYFRMSYDRLDDVNFPRRGQTASIEWSGDRTGLGSSSASNVVKLNWLAAYSYGRNTAVLWTSAGANLNATNGTVRTLFDLGGFLNLSGIAPSSVTGANYGIARLMFYRKVGSGGEGFLNVPMYAGFSLEAGNVWDRRSDASFSSARKDGSLFLGLDTLLGPVYLGFGLEDGGGTASYLFLGRTF